jgi:hypothetical protein
MRLMATVQDGLRPRGRPRLLHGFWRISEQKLSMTDAEGRA